MKVTIRSAVLVVVSAIALGWWALHGVAQPAPQSFAARIERLSEAGGDFDTDNLISNERSYLDVIPALKAAGVTGGAYIGVGPDQGFSYIAHVRPSIAFIVDIRRDNLLLHLLFKALFASAGNRAEYLCLLTGRPVPDRVETWAGRSLEQIAAYLDQTKSTPDTARDRGLDRRIASFGVPLTAADVSTIGRFHQTFIDAGLRLKFQSRGRAPSPNYPTYRDLLFATDRAGHAWNYLAAEADFQFVKSLEANDLVVPVVGDLGGTHALAAIAELMAARGDRLSAFYISNVETYLYGETYAQFVKNVTRLPRDARSLIIRSIFRNSISTSEVQSVDEFVSGRR